MRPYRDGQVFDTKLFGPIAADFIHDLRLNVDMSKTTRSEEQWPKSPGAFQLSWPTLSIVLAILGLGSLGTLVVIVSVKDVDLLATVALALAILSFAAQLIVSMIQTESNAKLNGDTKAALASIRATADALLSNQSDQFNRVLGAALRLIPAAVEDAATEVNPDEESGGSDVVSPSVTAIQDSFAKLFRENYNEKLKDLKFEPIRVTVGNQEVDKPLSSAERDVALSHVKELDNGTIDTLVRIAKAVRVSERHGLKPLAKFKRNDVARGQTFSNLIAHGLIEEISAPADGEMGMATYQLTPDGRLIARLLL